jgi:hypothetical protein
MARVKHDDPGDIVMSSTTDTPEQIREGLGLPAPEPVDPIAVAKQVLADAEALAAKAKSDAEALESERVAKENADAAPIVAAGDAKPAAAKKPKKAAAVAAVPVVDETAAKLAAIEAENADLKRQLEAAAKPSVVEPVKPVEPAELTSPRLKAIAAERAKLVEPTEDLFPDFNDLRRAEREYDRKLGELNAREDNERVRLEEQQERVAADAGRTAAQSVIAKFNERSDVVRAKFEDYDQVVTDDVKVGQAMAHVLLDPSNEAAGVMRYYLGKHRDEAQRIFDMDIAAAKAFQEGKPGGSPTPILLAMGEIRAKALAEFGTPQAPAGGHSGATQTGPTVAVVPKPQTTRAPEPPSEEAIQGGSTSLVVTKLEDAKTQAEYNRLRDLQVSGRRGRR